DVPAGWVARRLAAKGEPGAGAAGEFLWSRSDRGIPRPSLAEPPAFWSNPIRPDRSGSLPDESVWTPDRSMFFLRATSEDKGPLLEVSAPTGVARRASDPGADLHLLSADARGRIPLEGEARHATSSSGGENPLASASRARVPLPGNPVLHHYDVRRGREIGRTPGNVVARTKAGSVYAVVEYTGGDYELVHYGFNLKPVTRIALPEHWTTACLSADE